MISQALVFAGTLVCIASTLHGVASVRMDPVDAHRLLLSAVAPCLVLPVLAYLHAVQGQRHYCWKVCQCIGWVATFEIILLLTLTFAFTIVWAGLLAMKS